MDYDEFMNFMIDGNSINTGEPGGMTRQGESNLIDDSWVDTEISLDEVNNRFCNGNASSQVNLHRSMFMDVESDNGFHTDIGSESGNETDDELAEAEAIDSEFAAGNGYGFSDDPNSNPLSLNLNTEYSTAGFAKPINNPSPSFHQENRELQDLIDRTETVFEQLSMKAQDLIERQPLSTQIVLANLAKEQVFRPYEVHGSQTQLSESVMKFLNGGETVRRPGRAGLQKANDGVLRFVDADPVKTTDQRATAKRKARHADMGDNAASGDHEDNGRLKIRVVKKGQDLVTVVRQQQQDENQVHPLQLADSTAVPVFDTHEDLENQAEHTVDGLSYRKTSGPIDWAEVDTANSNHDLSPQTSGLEGTDPQHDLVAFPGRSRLCGNLDYLGPPSHRPSPISPLAIDFSQFQLQTPVTNSFPPLPAPEPSHNTRCNHSHSSVNSTYSPFNYSASVSPSANDILALEPYNPISLDVIWPATTRTDGRPCMPTPGLLDSLNRIMHIHNAEARSLLSYYIRKYNTPYYLRNAGPGESGAMSHSVDGRPVDEAPHALFRLGIAQWMMSKVEGIVENKETDGLGLTPEARRILGSVWESQPSMWTWFEDGFEDEENRGSDDNDLTESDEDEGEDTIMVTDTPEGGVLRMPKQKYRAKNPNPRHVKDGLNPMEKKLLARACNVSVETVQAYWDDMRDKTKAWAAMKLWCKARSLEKIARAKVDGTW